MKDIRAQIKSMRHAKLRSFGHKGDIHDRAEGHKHACEGGRMKRAHGGRVHKDIGGALDDMDMSGNPSKPNLAKRPRNAGTTININVAAKPDPSIPPPMPPPPMAPPPPPPMGGAPGASPMGPPPPMMPPGGGAPPMMATGGRIAKNFGGASCVPGGPPNPLGPYPHQQPPPGVPMGGPTPQPWRQDTGPRPQPWIQDTGPHQPIHPIQPQPTLGYHPPTGMMGTAPQAHLGSPWAAQGMGGGMFRAKGGRVGKAAGGPLLGAKPHRMPAAVAAGLPKAGIAPAPPMVPRGIPGPGSVPKIAKGGPIGTTGGFDGPEPYDNSKPDDRIRTQHDGYDNNPKERPGSKYGTRHQVVPAKAGGGHVELDAGSITGEGRLEKRAFHNRGRK